MTIDFVINKNAIDFLRIVSTAKSASLLVKNIGGVGNPIIQSLR